MEREKMSKTFTMDRRKEARSDFDSRLEFNLQKSRIRKKELDKKIYAYDFKPKINKNRINIYSKKAPVIAKVSRKPKIRESRETPVERSFVKKKSNLGKDTHLKKLNKAKEESVKASGKEKMEKTIGDNLESIKFDYSVTNNNSFESIHQRLRGSEFGFSAKKDESVQKEKKTYPQEAEFHQRQPEIKFSGFSKSQTRLNQKQNLKKSPTEGPSKEKPQVAANQSMSDLKGDQQDEREQQEDVLQNIDGLNLMMNKDNGNGRFVSNLVEKQTTETESENFFKLSTNEKMNPMKVHIKGHFSQS